MVCNQKTVIQSRQEFGTARLYIKAESKKQKQKNIEKQIENFGYLPAPKELEEFNSSEVMQDCQLAIKKALHTTVILIAKTYILTCNLGVLSTFSKVF